MCIRDSKCNILQTFCSLAWANGDLQNSLAYAEKALSALQDHDDHGELTLSNCLHHCGYLKALVGNTDEGVEMIQRAVSIDSRLYGEMYPVTLTRKKDLQRILNGEAISAVCPRSGW